MTKLVTMQPISLKAHPEVKEDTIQAYIFDHPEILGLGDLTAIRREKTQPSGGRLDMLLSDDSTRYEVEIQLGETDPSHIIRTIEYWDTERKRYPQYDHCAVIVAEKVTGRFMNVISLFNGSIPLIALQLTAFKNGDDISLTFTKVIDRVTYATDTEEEYEVTDRAYWEKKSTPKILKLVDEVFSEVQKLAPGYELKYNKFYIGLVCDGVSKNFVYFKPKKNYAYLYIKGTENSEVSERIDTIGLDSTYDSKRTAYRIRLNSAADYKNNRETLDPMITVAMQYFNLID